MPPNLVRWITLASLVLGVRAYIPAQAVNDTSAMGTSDDLIHISWLPNGVYSARLSRQLIADPVSNDSIPVISWTKYSKGVLVHFSENQTTQPPSNVPWIAMISCDANATQFSMIDDIFTLARDHGAQAALLYTVNAEGCLINPDYLTPQFEKPLDVYATRDKQSARLIENQFNLNVGASAYTYDSATLNNSASTIAQLLASDSLFIVGDIVVSSVVSDANTVLSTVSSNTGFDFTSNSNFGYTTLSDGSTSYYTDDSSYASSTDSSPLTSTYAPTRKLAVRQATPGSASSTPRSTRTSTTAAPTQTSMAASYLGAVMAAANMTVGPDAMGGTNATATGTASSGGGNSGPNTGLAMIILYAITGVVTFMFLVVILSGAIRAIRHPERYGPRAGFTRGGGGGGRAQQSRAGGLTRAILDTFPVVKFGRTGDDDDDERRRAEEEGRAKEVELEGMSTTHLVGVGVGAGAGKTEEQAKADKDKDREQRRHSGSSSSFVSAAAELPPMLPPPSDAASEATAPAAEPLPTINPADVDDGTTCPICVCEFEQGEDVRILPCDVKHRFHRDCIDPWLLQVSSLCPLCRLDLSGPKEDSGAGTEEDDAAGEQQVISNLRAMLQGHNRRDTSSGTAASGTSAGPAGAAATGTNGRNRFFRYVASRRRQAARNDVAPLHTVDNSASASGSGEGGADPASLGTAPPHR